MNKKIKAGIGIVALAIALGVGVYHFSSDKVGSNGEEAILPIDSDPVSLNDDDGASRLTEDGDESQGEKVVASDLERQKKKDTEKTDDTQEAQSSTSAGGGADEEKSVCLMEITCTPFLEHAKPSVKELLPKNGTIMGSTQVEIAPGDSVYDVLLRVCKSKNIQMSGSSTYVKSIANLAEKNYDNSTGWCYYVNGKLPDISAGAYKVKENDKIRWVYDAWQF